MGCDRVELGYDLTLDLVPGVQNMVAGGAVKVVSVHNYCPVPLGAPYGHPELFELASLDRRTRQSAIRHTSRTIQFAAEIGARFVIVHLGNIRVRSRTRALIGLHEKGKQHGPRYEKHKMKLYVQRDRRAERHLRELHAALGELLPLLKETGIRLAVENLPTWESIPTEPEAEALFRHFDSPHVLYWHDIGHGAVRENLGFVNQVRWLERLQPWLAGMHIHDVLPPAIDHLVPTAGNVDFAALKPFLKPDTALVFEPAPVIERADLVAAMQWIRETWGE